jgi:chorismate dehydratase
VRTTLLDRPRVAAFRYLNSLPLLHGLLIRPLPGSDRLRLDLGTPAECAAALEARRADAALVPSIEAARVPGLRHLPGIAISTSRRVRSVIVAARRPIESCRSLALDASSRTSVALLRILLARRFGGRPELSVMPPDPDRMLARHDGALLIADSALRPLPEGLRVYDLAEEWHAMTGLPFVFALWAVRDGSRFAAGDAELLAASHRQGTAALEEIAASEGPAIGLARDDALDYLRENLVYRFADAEQEGLARFLEMAAAEGLAPAGARVPPPWATAAEVGR